MSIFEVIMMACFGAAWPFSIYKSFKSHSVKGKSLMFLVTLEIGYVAGILHKWYYNFDGVIYLYFANAAMVLVDIILYFRNSYLVKLDTKISPDYH